MEAFITEDERLKILTKEEFLKSYSYLVNMI